jgi:pyruvate/2-oxoglutarate dehydrogenase complex dihydrolipoamide dehydrogenase (E3) component
VILGGGYIGCEFGQMFRRFGAHVTIVDHHDHLLAREDADISTEIEDVFRREGIALELGARAASISKDGESVIVMLEGGKSVRGSHLLVATGRRPNTDDLGCEHGGIDRDRHGAIVVDDHYHTSAEGVYAVGDAIGGPQFTHTSWDDHRLLFEHLQHGGGRGRSGRNVPYCVFTDPHVAGVGLTERRAREQGIDYEVATMRFADVARAAETDETAGTMKVLVDPKTERVLGASLVGAEAGELIHVFVALMQANASARAIVDAEFVHPTFAEGVQSLVMRLPRFALT